MSFATAADLPPEVVAHIVRLCCVCDERYNLDRNRLAACSLTCRYWSQLGRRNLLGSIILKSAADVSRLLDCLDAPARLSPSLRECIRHLYLVDRQPSPKSMPWLHHLVRLKSKLEPGVHVWVACTGESSQSAPVGPEAVPQHIALPLPFTTLPRTLPSSPFRLESLILRNTQLPSPAYLLRSISRLIVDDILLQQVTFTDLSVQGMRIPSQASCRRKVRVRAESDLLSDTEYFRSCFGLSHSIMAAQGCPPLNERTTSLIMGHISVLLQGTAPCSIYSLYRPQDSARPYSAYMCSDATKFALS